MDNSHPLTERASKEVLGTPLLNISTYPNVDKHLENNFISKQGPI